jgi:hypothetical protein
VSSVDDDDMVGSDVDSDGTADTDEPLVDGVAIVNDDEEEL